MARFDVFSNPGRHPGTPYVVEVQGNHLSGLATRVVVLLRRLDRIAPVPLPPDLIPVFVIEGIECMLDTPTLAAIPRSVLTKPITSLMYRQDEIVSVLDRLFGGWQVRSHPRCRVSVSLARPTFGSRAEVERSCLTIGNS